MGIVGCALWVASNGNVGIGTTTPWGKFSLAALSSNTAPIFALSTSTASATSTAFFIDSNGLVGIGTSTPTTALQVAGTITPNQDNAFNAGNATYRWAAVYAANGTIQTSDQRLKSNVTDLNYGLPDLLKLRPVSFTWTAQPSQGTKLGFIAQEVQPVLPETVNIGDDANHTLGLTYTEFIPVVVRAIQQLDQQLTDLATTVADFADRFTTKDLTFTRATGDEIDVKTANVHKLCVADDTGASTCITKSQLDAFLANTGQTAAAAPAVPTSPAQSSPPTDSTATSTAATPSLSTDGSSTPVVSDSPSIIPSDTPESTSDRTATDTSPATEPAPTAQ
jgi:hypothetical protein